ncbi:class I SAM-dependent methyltransferase [Pedococcus sp. NPDC057267]|uniref:class I SAM-dependent methyltransferase n=1 Tax=Pedococcus sp. NPDC057267 TaxID=3346077 RepID=UPI00362A090A
MDVTTASAPALRYRNEGNLRLLDLISRPPGRVLDVGCGPGDNAAIMAGRGWRVEGVTIDPEEARAARSVCARVHVGDLEKGLPDSIEGTFDVAIFSHVLEHIRQPESTLRQVAPLLGADGVVAVALPNVLHYRQRLAFFRGRFDYTDTGILDRTHLRFYTYASARMMIESAGYRVLDSVPDGPLPVGRLTTRLPDRMRNSLRTLALSQLPGLLAYQSLFVARPSQLTD